MDGSILALIANHNPSGFGLQNQQRQTAIDEARAQTGLTEQATQDAALKNQVLQQQLKDADIFRRAYINTDGTPSSVRDYMLRNGISGSGFQSWQAHQRKLLETSHNQAANIIDSINSTTDPQARTALYTQSLPQLKQLAPDVQWQDAYDPDYGKFVTGVLGHANTVLERTKTQSEIEKANSATAAEQQKLRESKRGESASALQQVLNPDGTVSPASFADWQKRYPADVTGLVTPTKEGVQQYIKAVGVPIKEAPEYDIKNRQAQAMAAMKPEDWDARVDSVVPASGDTAALNQRTKSQVRGAVSMGLPLTAVEAVIKDASDQIGRTETAVRTAQATKPIKIEVAAGTTAARTPAPSSDALDLMAENALAGQMPSSRNPILYSRVMDRAAQLAKERGLTAQQAVMERNAAQANKSAFAAVTKQYETLKPFADMAEKNADILEQKMANVADLGAPVLNTPVRMLQSKFGGNTNVAALQAALLPVQADFARILNSPTGSGVLSDTARHEMEGAIQPGATVGQMRAALSVFRQDAKNRREAYEAQLADLKTRTVAGQTGRTGSGTANPTGTSLMRVRRRSDGATGTLDPKDFDPAKYEKVQ